MTDVTDDYVTLSGSGRLLTVGSRYVICRIGRRDLINRYLSSALVSLQRPTALHAY